MLDKASGLARIGMCERLARDEWRERREDFGKELETCVRNFDTDQELQQVLGQFI